MRVRIDNYRPWSPVKTNPLFIHDDDLLFEKSKTFNIFSNLEETLEEKIWTQKFQSSGCFSTDSLDGIFQQNKFLNLYFWLYFFLLFQIKWMPILTKTKEKIKQELILAVWLTAGVQEFWTSRTYPFLLRAFSLWVKWLCEWINFSACWQQFIRFSQIGWICWGLCAVSKFSRSFPSLC